MYKESLKTQREQIFMALKKILSSRKVKYRELANNLGMSESGVKKIFLEKNCSLDKILKICEAINYSFFNVLEEINSPSMDKQISIPIELDYILARKPRIFYLLRAIQAGGQKKEELFRRGFLEQDLNLAKELLVKFKILKNNESIFRLKKTIMKLDEKSKLKNVFLKNISKKIVMSRIDGNEKEKSLKPYIWAAPLSNSDQSYLSEEILQVFKKYEKRSSLYAEFVEDGEAELTYVVVPARLTPGVDLVEQIDLL